MLERLYVLLNINDRGGDRLISDLLNWLYYNCLDYINTFPRNLTQIDQQAGQIYAPPEFSDSFKQSSDRVCAKVDEEQSESISSCRDLLSALESPYIDQLYCRGLIKNYSKPNECVYQEFFGTWFSRKMNNH